MAPWYRLVLGSLATWRLAHLLHAEDGPFLLLAKLRRAAGIGIIGQLLDCFYCLSLWVAAPFAYLLGQSWTERALLLPALSAAAIVIERLTSPVTTPEPPLPHYTEDAE